MSASIFIFLMSEIARKMLKFLCERYWILNVSGTATCVYLLLLWHIGRKHVIPRFWCLHWTRPCFLDMNFHFEKQAAYLEAGRSDVRQDWVSMRVMQRSKSFPHQSRWSPRSLWNRVLGVVLRKIRVQRNDGQEGRQTQLKAPKNV